MSTSSSPRRGVDLSRVSLGRRMRERFSEPSMLRAIQRRAQPAEVLRRDALDEMGDFAFGRAEIGERLIAGDFAHGVERMRSTATAMWSTSEPSPSFAADLHGFGWLADLEALGDAEARRFAGAAFRSWRAATPGYAPIPWRADVATRRLRAWLLHGRLIGSGPGRAEGATDVRGRSSGRDDEAFAKAIWAHGDWLLRRQSELPAGRDRLRAAAVATAATLMIDGWISRLPAAATALETALRTGLAADGAPLSRSPADAFEAFVDLRLVSALFEAAREPLPEPVETALIGLARTVRFFRSADGGLALFHGAAELGDGRVDAALAAARLRAAPAESLPETGFERIAGGRVIAHLDVAGNPDGPAADTAHASALAIEIASGRRRLVVNSGPSGHLDEQWRRALRSANAHSTATLDDAPFVSAVMREAPVTGEEGRALVGPEAIACAREEERGGSWVLAGHDGYLPSHGVRVTRRVFLSSDGGDLRGEDGFFVEGAEHERVFARRLSRLPRAQRQDGFVVTARFHLHPDVAAAMVADGEAITLRLPHGEVWVMRQAGGALSLAQSVYTGAGGAPTSTRQIVVTASAGDTATKIRWAFRRVGELEQLPRDVEGLLRLAAMDAEDDEGAGAAGRVATRREPL